MPKACWVVCYRSISDPKAGRNTPSLPFLPSSLPVGAISPANQQPISVYQLEMISS